MLLLARDIVKRDARKPDVPFLITYVCYEGND